MKRVIALSSALSACCLGHAVAWAGPSTVPAATIAGATSRPTTRHGPPAMTQLIAAIRDTTDLETAARKYAEAGKIDKDNVALHETYMKKMLKLGRPNVALYPAMELTRLAAKSGTAWGTIGYNHARRAGYLLALTATIRGMQLLPGDPGIQNNAGVLLAWYDNVSAKPKLTESFRALLNDQSKKWRQKKGFASAYKEYASDYSAWKKHVAKLKGDLVTAEQAAKNAARDSGQASGSYRDNRREIADLEDGIKVMKRQLAETFRPSLGEGPRDRERRYSRQPVLKAKINDGEKRLKMLKQRRGALRQTASQAMKGLKGAKKALADAKAALNAEKRKPPLPRWLPPAVDGVITPEGKASRGPAATTSVALQPGRGSRAEAQLKMARLLLRNNRASQAAKVLRGIIQQYPDTGAAKEAKALLEEHKLAEEQ